MPELRKRGHIPDHPAVEAIRLGLHMHPEFGAIKSIVLPLSSNNRVKLPASKGGPGILNQNDSSSCEGHAHASGGTLRMAIAGTPVPLLSPVGMYEGALMVDRTPNPDGTLPYLIDQGTMPSSIMTGLGLYGVSAATKFGEYPASSQSMYIDPNGTDPNIPQGAIKEPSPEQLIGERVMRLNGAYYIQTTGLAKVIQMLQVLASGRPISDAIPASGPDFQGYSGGILGALEGPVDHANLIVDYVWSGTQAQFDSWQGGAPNLDQYLLGIGDNSWGMGWGEADVTGVCDTTEVTGGLYRFNRAYFDQCQSPCALDLQKVAA